MKSLGFCKKRGISGSISRLLRKRTSRSKLAVVAGVGKAAGNFGVVGALENLVAQKFLLLLCDVFGDLLLHGVSI